MKKARCSNYIEQGNVEYCGGYQYKGKEISILNLYNGLGNGEGVLDFDEMFEQIRGTRIKKLIINVETTSKDFKIDSIGLGKIIGLLTSVNNQGGGVVFSNIHGRFAKILKTTKLNTIIPMYDSMKEALDSF